MTTADLHIGILTERMTLGFGVDVVIHEQAVRLIQRGYRVTIFPGWMTDMYLDQPYALIPLTKSNDDEVNYHSPEFLNRSFNILNQYKVDVWIIHTPPFYSWLDHLPPPVIMVEHGTPSGKFFNYRQGKTLDMETRKRHRSIFRSRRTGDGLVAISEYIRSELPLDVQRSTVVIHNGADHYPRVSPDQSRIFREEHGITPGEIMVLWVGRLQPIRDPQPYKGLNELLKISSGLMKSNPDIRLIAVGRGEESVIPLLKQAGVTPVLNLAREKMASAYAAADIFLSTSLWEGFNLPLAEAQFQGTPVVALNVCAHPEVVSHGLSGLLADRAEELPNVIISLAEDGEWRKRLSNGALAHSAELSWDRNVDKLEKTIHGCLKALTSGVQMLPIEASLRKSPRYYLNYAEYLLRRFGWRTFIYECFGWIRRRIPGKKT
ncbi:glycosyltransferase family 4 protein [bacterium]|nr:glycosyltransferase family 4 protein [candidate division CSSED10-310 bacterium]